MKNIKSIAKFLTVLLFSVIAAAAGDLRNEDGRRYEIRIHDGPTTTNSSIDANSTALSICTSCEIEVVGVGRVKISGSERAVIKNGKLSKQ